MIYDADGNAIDERSLDIKATSTGQKQGIEDFIGTFQENLMLNSGMTEEEFNNNSNFFRTLNQERINKPIDEASYQSPAFSEARQFKEGLDFARQYGIEEGIESNIEQDSQTNFNALKKVTHDYAHMDSAEQGVTDWVHIQAAKRNKSEMVSKSEAEQRAKDAQVDLKFDKPITEGELEYSIKKAVRKKELAQQMAYYRSTGDYNALQKLMLTGSALSGGMGFLELAGTGLLAWAGGEGIALGLGRAATVLGEATSITRGVYTAQRVAYANKMARTWGNAITEAQKAGDTAKMAEAINKTKYWANRVQQAEGYTKKTADTASFGEKLGYDAYRFGTQTMGEHASLASTMVPFSVDGALSTIPAELIKYGADKATHENEYTLKEMAATVAYGGAFGAALPAIGTGLRQAPKALNKIQEVMTTSFAEKANKKATEGLLEGNQALVEEAEAVGEASSKMLDDIMDVAKDKGPLANAEQALGDAIASANVSDAEYQNALLYTFNCLKKGQYPNIDSLPIRNMYYSDVPGLLDNILEHAKLNKDGEELIKFLDANGIKIETKGKALFKDALEDNIEMLNTGKWGSFAKIGSETKALGRTFAFGLNQEEANKFLGNVYLARMGGDTEASIQAGIDAEEYIAKLIQIQKQAQHIVDTYDIIEHQAGKEEYFTMLEQQTIYNLSSGGQGTLRDALVDLSELMLPESIRKELESSKQIVQKAQTELNLADNLIETSAEDYEKAMDVLMQAQQYTDAFLEKVYHEEPSKNGKYMFQRLSAIEESKEQTRYLKDLANQMNEGILDDANLLNTDRIFEQSLESPEQILKRIEGSNEVSELSYIYNQNSISAKEMKDLIKDREATNSLLETAKINLAKYDGTPVFDSVKSILDEMVRTTDSSGTRNNYGYLHGIKNSIQALDEILSSQAGSIRDKFIDLVHQNKYLQTIAKETIISEDSLLRVASEEGAAFSKLLKQAINETITTKLPPGSFGEQFNEMLEEVTNNFIDYLRANPNKAITTLTEQHAFNAELNTAEEAVEEVTKAMQQKSVYDSMLEPMLANLTEACTRMQARLLNEQANTYRLWERCLKTPGKMSEAILGDVTMTWLPTKGASASIENIADIQTEWRQFLQVLDSHDFGNERLSDWAFEPNNFNSIRDAIADTWMATNGMLSEEQLQAFNKTVANTQAGRVAEAFINSHANLQKQLYNLGSNANDITKLFNGNKLAMADSIISTNAIHSKVGGYIKALSRPQVVGQGENARPKHLKIAQTFERFLPKSNDKADLRQANLGMRLFEVLDLDKHFGKGAPTKIGLNEFRDEILAGTSLDKLAEKYGAKDITAACTKIANGILGKEDKTSVGLIGKMRTGSRNIMQEMQSYKSKYIEDLKPRLQYKDANSFKQDLADLGYDDLRSWFEMSMKNGKRAYAVMRKAGAEPFQFYQNIMDMATTFASSQKLVGPLVKNENHISSIRESLSPVWRSRVNFAVNQVCGTYQTTPSVPMRITQNIIRTLSAPMLMKAGVKSLSDYAYQYQYLVTMGLRSSTNMSDRFNVYNKIITSCTRDKKLLKDIYMSQQLRTNVMYEMLYNEPIGNGMLKKFGNLNEWAPNWAIWEQRSKSYSSFMLDKLAWIEPMTNYNRMNAAYNVMQSLGEYSTTKFADMPKRLQASLGRFDISANEWDNLFSTKAVSNMNSYVARIHKGEGIGELGNAPMFFPDLIAELPEQDIVDIMKTEGISVTPENIINYKQALIDKASMIVNVSANEMTTIPTARIQGALLFGQDPNTWTGMGLSALTQFQSFGTGVNFYHWGRRLAANLDPSDPLYNKVLMYALDKGTATNMLGFVAELALFQFFLNKAVSLTAGNNKAIFDDNGFHGDNLSEQTAKAIIDQAGVLGPMLDAVMTNFEKGRGAGGGIALSLLPSGSSVLSQASRVAQAATKESTKDNRAQAVGGALIQNAAYYTGFPNQIFTQAVWGLLIGDKLTEWQQGSNYNRYMSQRARNGYNPSWARNLWETIEY